jgi:Trk-type K+ transport system membrane component
MLLFEMIPAILFFAFIGLWVYMYYNTRHKERMSMIERGVDASLLFQKKQSGTGKYPALKYGLAISFTGLGVLLGFVANPFSPEYYDGVFFVFFAIGLVILFAGLGFVVYYLIIRKIEKSGQL